MPVIRYGDRIYLRHSATNVWLKASNKLYIHPGGSGQHIVGAEATLSAAALWQVKGADGTPPNYRRGEPVSNHDVIRLEHVQTRRNLHSHNGPVSPMTGQREVTAYSDHANGVGDGNDNWTVELASPGVWRTGIAMRLAWETGWRLHSHAGGYCDPQATAGLQEVTAWNSGDSNDLWQALTNQREAAAATWEVTFFVSHSTRDAALARSIVRLLERSLRLGPENIRCSSVPGYGFPVAADIGRKVRREVRRSRIFVALATINSMTSPYVLFEMGARWGQQMDLFVLATRNAEALLSRTPISGEFRLRLSVAVELRVFLTRMGRILRRHLSPAEMYEDELQDVVLKARALETTKVRH